jgi:hypothetical protein
VGGEDASQVGGSARVGVIIEGGVGHRQAARGDVTEQLGAGRFVEPVQRGTGHGRVADRLGDRDESGGHVAVSWWRAGR